MELLKVDSPPLSPNRCIICQGSTGPFVWVPGITMVALPTVEGPMNVRTGIAICLGPDDERPGCITQLARFASFVAGHEHAEVVGERDELARICSNQRDRLAANRGELSTLTSSLAEAREEAIAAAG